MLSWSINLFRVRGIQLAVHVSFFLLLAYVADAGWRDGGLAGSLWAVAILLACFTCVVLHELGHSFTAMHFGIRVPRILLMPIGGMAQFDEIPREPARELLITIAGPAVNFAIAGLLALFVEMPSWPFSDYDYHADAHGTAQLLLAWNLVMGVFNLVPVFPMDGGRILRACLAMRVPYLQATFWAASLGKVLAIFAAILALVAWNRPLIAVLFLFIFFVGHAEYRAAMRRELDEARHREMLARWYSQMPPP
ncbi:MAG: site-2 protease family protein, partial [Opitutaceae bacterium]